MHGCGGLVMGLVIGLVMTGGAYWMSDKLAIAAARAQPVAPGQMPEYERIVADLAQRADIPMPRLYVAPNPQPNAFATGRNPANAAVCINSGLVDQLSWEEIQGVLAHEISHVRNRDILTSSVAAAVAQGISFVANMAMWGAMFGGGGGRDRDGGTSSAAGVHQSGQSDHGLSERAEPPVCRPGVSPQRHAGVGIHRTRNLGHARCRRVGETVEHQGRT